MSRSYEDLKVWQRAMDLVYVIYDMTRAFPKDELYGLVSQMRRAAVSIPSNIAEGKGRSTDKDFAVFLHHSRGSLHELETQIRIAHHLGYIPAAANPSLSELVSEVGRLLNGLINFATNA
ncbi:MAG: four helix bundle protein [Terriglobales bacterium]|jgi:four helix bundle protein